MSWWEVPPDVRARVEEVLGSSVGEAHSQTGGFSPGSADRLVTQTGRRAFVKIASLAANPDAPGILRAEAAITASLPAWVPAPEYIGFIDEVEWVALVLEDIDGRHPRTPWTTGELDAVLDALHAMTSMPAPLELDIAEAPKVLAGLGGNWEAIAAGETALPAMPYGLDVWTAKRINEFSEAAEQAPNDVAGDRLIHLDTRADNLLFRPDGRLVLIDWPWAARGAGWFDALTLLVNVRYFDPGFDVESIVAKHPVFAALTAEAATRTLIALAGFLTRSSALPPVPGIPSLRTFQRDDAVATLSWLRERLGD